MMDILNIHKEEIVENSGISTANCLEIIEEYLRKSYLGRLNEMQVAPTGSLQELENDLIDNIRLYHIDEMVYKKGEPVTDKFTTVFNTLKRALSIRLQLMVRKTSKLAICFAMMRR